MRISACSWSEQLLRAPGLGFSGQIGRRPRTHSRAAPGPGWLSHGGAPVLDPAGRASKRCRWRRWPEVRVGARRLGAALASGAPGGRPYTNTHTHTHTRSCDEMSTARAHILSGVLIRRRARRPPWGPISGRHRKLDTCRGRRAPAAASTLGRRHHLAAGPQAWRGRSRRPGCDRRHQVAPGRPIRTHARLPAGPVNTGAEWRPRRRCSVAVTSPTERHCGAVPSRDACVRAR